jgi:hypothetical protein
VYGLCELNRARVRTARIVIIRVATDCRAAQPVADRQAGLVDAAI